MRGERYYTQQTTDDYELVHEYEPRYTSSRSPAKPKDVRYVSLQNSLAYDNDNNPGLKAQAHFASTKIGKS